MPLISVIIPVYNGEKTIQETLESVFQQTLTDLEVLVINDGSTDETLQVLSQITDARLKVLSYPNGGVARSRNRGIEEARGDYIAFLDADDLWTPDKLESQFKALQEHPQAGVAYSWTDYIDEKSQFLHPGEHITENGEIYEKLLLTNFLDNGSNPLIRAQALQEVGNFDESLPPVEDWDMWVRLAARYPFITVPRPQVLYRMSAEGNSANIDKMERQARRFLDQTFKQAPESLQHLKKRSLSKLYHYLTLRAIEGELTRKKGLTAARCFWGIVQNDPALLKRRSRLMAIVLGKIIAAIVLPNGKAEPLLNSGKAFFKTIKNQ